MCTENNSPPVAQNQLQQTVLVLASYLYMYKGVAMQGVSFTEALAEFQHVNCMLVQIWEVKRVACYARAETFTEAVLPRLPHW